ncbi:hypothetical protein GCM10025875_09620 [Litorihabitans aurantiacus]|uniref:FHA domain-containing protein n=1 Tax=Litorihabitans aurantiacus TaxID=1930061 RepID=A0AA37UM15_9MICO|nr:hypothetical protein GCM10025875_09620 [Litorihabitans aurantiacus]
MRVRAIATLSETLARPSRFVRQVVALLLVGGGVALATGRVGAGGSESAAVTPVGPTAGVIVLGIGLGLLGVLLAVAPVREGWRASHALQLWLAPLARTAGAPGAGVPQLTSLLRGVGVLRLIGCGVLAVGVVMTLLAVTGVLGAPGGRGGPAEAGEVLAGVAAVLPALVAIVLAATTTLRIHRGRRGHAGRTSDESEVRASDGFAPVAPRSGLPVGVEPFRAPAPAPSVPAPPVPAQPKPTTGPAAASGPASTAGSPAIVTGIPLEPRPLPLDPGDPTPFATTTRPGPPPGWPATAAGDLPEETVARSDLPENTVTRADLGARPRLAVVLEDGDRPRALGPGRWLLGRAPSARAGEDGLLPLVVEDPAVSKTHLLLDVGDEAVAVTDRASSNGTHVVRGGDRRLITAWQAVALADGDRVEVGALVVRVTSTPPPR